MATPILALLDPLQDREMKRKFSAAILVGSLSITTLAVVNTPDRKPKYPCRVEVSFPHISTNILKNQGIRAVKVNAFSTCNRPHSRVTLSVQLWKENLVFKEKLIETVERRPGLIPAGMRFYNEGTFVPCLNYKETRFFGIAFGKAMIDGKWYFAQHRLDVVVPPVRCGT